MVEHWTTTISLLMSGIITWLTSVIRLPDAARGNSFNLHLTSLSYFCLIFSGPITARQGALRLLLANQILSYVRQDKQMIDTNITFCFREIQTIGLQ